MVVDNNLDYVKELANNLSIDDLRELGDFCFSLADALEEDEQRLLEDGEEK